MADWIPRADTTIGRLLRLPLRLIPPERTVRILRGPCRGMRWIAGSGPHSCWLGINEIRKRRLFSRVVQPGDVVYDLGAHAGSYALLAAVLAGSDGHVVAFEPYPGNLEYLRKHVTLNALDHRVTVVAAAVTNRSGSVRFTPTADRVRSRVDPGGSLDVRSVTLDEWVGRPGVRPPDCIKIDVEGAEADVLAGATRTLARFRPHVFVATHGVEEARACRQRLEELAYEVTSVPGHPDELVALAADRRPAGG